jgi:hypothetical protein
LADGDDGEAEGDDGAGGGDDGDAEPEVVGTTEKGSAAEVTALEWLVVAQDARSSHIIQTSTNRYRPAANPICHDDT